MRTQPQLASRPRDSGPAVFVDSNRGDDSQTGTESQPWKSLRHALRQQPTERDVFNNILVQRKGVPGPGFVAIQEPGLLREGGNLLWGVEEGRMASGDPFAKFRTSPLFKLSQQQYPPGWTTQDRLADPMFAGLPADPSEASDLRLQSGSPAIDAGLTVSADWPDPLREFDRGQPDIGAVPLGVEPWGVGVNGRLSVFSGKPMADTQ